MDIKRPGSTSNTSNLPEINGLLERIQSDEIGPRPLGDQEIEDEEGTPPHRVDATEREEELEENHLIVKDCEEKRGLVVRDAPLAVDGAKPGVNGRAANEHPDGQKSAAQRECPDCTERVTPCPRIRRRQHENAKGFGDVHQLEGNLAEGGGRGKGFGDAAERDAPCTAPGDPIYPSLEALQLSFHIPRKAACVNRRPAVAK